MTSFQFHSLSLNEQKYLKELWERKSLQLLACDSSGGYFASAGASKILARSQVLCHITEDKTTCFGKLADKSFVYPQKDAGFIRVFLDRKNKENLKLVINNNGDCFEYYDENDTGAKKEMFALFLEDDHFAQLVWFDNLISPKVHQIMVTDSRSKENIRVMALSYISKLIPSVEWSKIWINSPYEGVSGEEEE